MNLDLKLSKELICFHFFHTRTLKATFVYCERRQERVRRILQYQTQRRVRKKDT